MRKNIEETLHFYISNEINSFNQSSLCSKLFDLVNQLGFHIECSFGCGDNNSKDIYFSFLVVDNNGEGVPAGEYDEFAHLNAATLIIAIDKKDKIKFYSWEEDDDFIDSINWVVKELEKKL